LRDETIGEVVREDDRTENNGRRLSSAGKEGNV